MGDFETEIATSMDKLLANARITQTLGKLPSTTDNKPDGLYVQDSTREVGVFLEIYRIAEIHAPSSTFDAQFEIQLTLVADSQRPQGV